MDELLKKKYEAGLEQAKGAHSSNISSDLIDLFVRAAKQDSESISEVVKILLGNIDVHTSNTTASLYCLIRLADVSARTKEIITSTLPEGFLEYYAADENAQVASNAQILRSVLNGTPLSDFKSHAEAPKKLDGYINPDIILGYQAKSKTGASGFNYEKLLGLLVELNANYDSKNQYSCYLLIKAILNHVPPLLGYPTFIQLVNEYKGWTSKSHIDYVQYLEKTFTPETHDATHTRISGRRDQLSMDSINQAKSALNTLLEECRDQMVDRVPSFRPVQVPGSKNTVKDKIADFKKKYPLELLGKDGGYVFIVKRGSENHIYLLDKKTGSKHHVANTDTLRRIWIPDPPKTVLGADKFDAIDFGESINLET